MYSPIDGGIDALQEIIWKITFRKLSRRSYEAAKRIGEQSQREREREEKETLKRGLGVNIAWQWCTEYIPEGVTWCKIEDSAFS